MLLKEIEDQVLVRDSMNKSYKIEVPVKAGTTSWANTRTIDLRRLSDAPNLFPPTHY